MTSSSVDITFFGTGEFAARALFDMAASASEPLTVQVVGRNAARLAWLRTAANARAVLFGAPLRVQTHICSDFDEASVCRILERSRPRVVFQAASLQTASVIRSTDNGWSQLVQQGGLSATAPFQAVLSLRIGKAIQKVLPSAFFINGCFPDVVNPILHAAGVPALCGVGNIGILSNAFAGSPTGRNANSLQVLAHYQQLGVWRRLPEERGGSTPRVWLNGEEVSDVFKQFDDVMLSPEAAFDISGATGVPLMCALALGKPWQGHVPGPCGLPGGYPVQIDAQGRISLDLPCGLSRADAVAWNNAFEQRNGMTVDSTGRASYHGRLHELLATHDAALVQGFNCLDVEEIALRLSTLRNHLQSQAASH